MSSMAEAPTRRRWFQFGMGTMFWLVLVGALFAYALSERSKRIEAERNAAAIPRYPGAP
jgi:hypothetical protein